MGEVYRARDPRLNRDVAIKISAAQFSERFEREAKAVAALNHPNICHLYDVGPNYLVMEYIEGECSAGSAATRRGAAHHAPNRRRVGSRPRKRHHASRSEAGQHQNQARWHGEGAGLRFGESLRWFAGFAIRKLAHAEHGRDADGRDPGHGRYMSPEQARGKAVDKRADIWAFGAVFYELLMGKRLFQGEDVSHTMAAVIMQEPNLDVVPGPACGSFCSGVWRRTEKRCGILAMCGSCWIPLLHSHGSEWTVRSERAREEWVGGPVGRGGLWQR